MINPQIKKILEAGTLAPSGDNSQPWKFEMRGDTVRVMNLPQKDNPIFNYKQRGSFVAHGALIENIVIYASAFGYTAEPRIFPEGENSDIVADITLTKKTPSIEPLCPAIFKRATNRKPYTARALTHEERAALTSSVEHISGARLFFIEDAEKIKNLAEAVSLAEELMLQNREMHDYFFHHICWTREEEEKNRSGLFVNTLELAPLQLFIFKLLRYWSVARALGVLGFPKFIARENAKIYRDRKSVV